MTPNEGDVGGTNPMVKSTKDLRYHCQAVTLDYNAIHHASEYLA